MTQVTRVRALLVPALLAVAALAGAGQDAASAHSVGPPAEVEERVIGREHARQHAKIWRAITRGWKRWQRMTPKQRRAWRRREARSRRERASAAHHDVPAEPASEVGRWAAPFTVTTGYRGYGIHAALLHTGKVLFWGYPMHRATNGYVERGNETYAWLWDPAQGQGLHAVEDVTPGGPGSGIPSIYCSGMSFLPDGRLLAVGGNLTWPNGMEGYTKFAGLNIGLVFDPDTEEWTELERPTGFRGRWYPSQVLLGDGRSFVISGFTDEAPGGILNEDLELYEPPSPGDALGTFRLFDSDAQRRRTDLYPHLFTMPDGNVLMAGPGVPDNALLDPAALDDPAVNPWTELDRQSAQRTGGNAVLEPEGPAGSSRVLQIAGEVNGAAVPHATTERLDLDDATPAWTFGPTLNYGRSYPNTIILPDRTLATIGGGVRPYSSVGRRMELLAPGASQWTLGPKQDEDRAYHSTALLLPDGRVMSGGDDFSPSVDGTRQTSSPDDTVELYSPPYLYKGGTRPAITSGATRLAWNEPFSVAFTADASRPVSTAVLVAPGASTHGVDMHQRLVPLAVTGSSANALQLVAPPDPNVAPPGRYMLFVVDSAGVPSIARWVQLGPRAAIEVEGEHRAGNTLTLRSTQPLVAGPGARQESWDLDGNGSYEVTGPTRTTSFARPGSYPVGLRVTTGFLTTETSRTIVIPNTAPVASFDVAPASPRAGDTVTLTSTSSDAESGVTTAWDLDGDGIYPDAIGPTTSLTFGSPGNYPVGLRVRDADGGETVITRTVVVASAAPPPDPDPPPPDPDPQPDPTPEPDPQPDPTPEPDPEPDPTPDPQPDPTPEPDPQPEPDPEPDLIAPTLQLGFPEQTWLSRLRRDGLLRVRVMVDEPATVQLAFFRGLRRVGRVRADLVPGRTRTLVIRPRRETLRWIRRTRAPRLRFSATAVDAARNNTAWTRVLRPSDRRRR
ncbi:MAG: hypothetical protein QOJ22_367 [Thermoleophilaceae bacterium]|nr:hypothetical protein [Thermoleophilaceae bacterium]